MYSVTRSFGLNGLSGFAVAVEADISGGLPAFSIVGLPDSAVRESADRVRAAIKNLGFKFPDRRITVNLAPADVRKTGPVYDLPLLLAVLTARLMRRFMFPVDETPFVMELPPYRIPTMRATLSHMWDKCAQYLRKMGGLILVASIVVWFLSYYPRQDTAGPATDHYENSYLGRIGKACEPIFAPLGLNWKANVAILSGVAAKEVVVSTLGVLYADGEQAPETEEQITTLSQRLWDSGDFDAASALALLVFLLVYFPCLATVAAIASEAGWRWAALAVLYDTGMAWLLAWMAYHLMRLF